MEGGLADLVATMEAMAVGAASNSFFLSSLDPGVGKTTALICFIQQLLSCWSYEGVAALICLSRIDEVKRLVDEMGLSASDFAVLTRDDEANGLSATDGGQARVLFTTHEMVYKSCSGKPFSDVDAFKYQGWVRDVRVWDEAAVPGKAVSLSTDGLAALRGPLRSAHPSLAAEVEQLELAIKAADLSVPFSFPDVQVVSGVSRWAARSGQNQTHGDQLKALYTLSDQLVLLRKRDNRSSVITALNTRDALPADLAPMIIMDASGRVRATYDLWEEKGNLVRLKEAPRRYDNLTIRVMDKGGSRSSWNANGEVLAKEVASRVDTKPNEDWLVIYPKAACGGAAPDMIKGLLNTDPQRVSFLNWGQHQGTNEYRHIPNVILAGTMFYTEADYEMMVRGCGGIPNDQEFPEHLIHQMKNGEHMHHILQALCRSSVRQGVGASCGRCDAYIIASKGSGIRDLLPTTFPGCRIKAWEQIKKKLSGKVGEAVGYVEAFFEAAPNGFFLLCELKDKLGITDTSNFNKTIRKHGSFKAALERLGLEEVVWGTGRIKNALKKKPAILGPVPGSTYVADV